MPAMRVCQEWGSLLLDERTVVACESQACTDWLGSLLSTTGFWRRAQETVVRAFGLGAGTFAVWMDVRRHPVRVRHYDARMVVPLSCDANGVRECAFVTRCFSRGTLLDQLQMHMGGRRRRVQDPHGLLRRVNGNLEATVDFYLSEYNERADVGQEEHRLVLHAGHEPRRLPSRPHLRARSGIRLRRGEERLPATRLWLFHGPPPVIGGCPIIPEQPYIRR